MPIDKHHILVNRLTTIHDRLDDLNPESWSSYHNYIKDETDENAKLVRKELNDFLACMKMLKTEIEDARKFIKNNFPEE